jgi:peptidoglycan hydrolase-like protein with peptidoglycan-binding domain
MKKITENDLLQKVSKLKEYIAVVESEQVNEVNWGALGTGAMNAVRGAGGAISNALGTTAGKVAAGTALGVGGTLAAQKLAGGQAPAPAGTTAKVPGKPDPNVMALQQKLIAAGAKIKADGIMGPATRAAQAQFPNVTTQTAAEKAAAGGAGAGMVATAADQAAAGAAPAPTMTAADQEDADMGAAMQANAAAAPATAAAPTKAQQLVAQAGLPQPGASAEDMLKNMQALPGMDPAKMMADQQARMAAMKAKTAAAPAAAPTATAGTPPPATESVNFRNDELNRIVSLVRYR